MPSNHFLNSYKHNHVSWHASDTTLKFKTTIILPFSWVMYWWVWFWSIYALATQLHRRLQFPPPTALRICQWGSWWWVCSWDWSSLRCWRWITAVLVLIAWGVEVRGDKNYYFCLATFEFDEELTPYATIIMWSFHLFHSILTAEFIVNSNSISGPLSNRLKGPAAKWI